MLPWICIFIIILIFYEEHRKKRRFWTSNIDFKNLFENNIGRNCIIEYDCFFLSLNRRCCGKIVNVTDKAVELSLTKSKQIVIINIDFISKVSMD